MGSTSLSQTSEMEDIDEYFPEIEIEENQEMSNQEKPYKRIKHGLGSGILSRQ